LEAKNLGFFVRKQHSIIFKEPKSKREIKQAKLEQAKERKKINSIMQSYMGAIHQIKQSKKPTALRSTKNFFKDIQDVKRISRTSQLN